MKILIAGGTGQVGTVLARAFHGAGHDVVVLSRSAPTRQLSERPDMGSGPNAHVSEGRDTSGPAWRVARWEPRNPSAWAHEVDGTDVVVNLAGRSVNCRYTKANREEILRSRVDSVGGLGQAIALARRPPSTWLQASTATIYAHRHDAPNDERTGFIGGAEPGAPDTWRFSIDVATAWERALDEMPTPSTRKVKLRSAMVMSPDSGGIFDTLLGLVRRGLGGMSGDGRQYVSWIHEADFVRAVTFLVERSDMNGAVNVASPNPLPNREFMAALRRAWGARIGLPATEWMLEIGARVLGTETELVLKSRRVVPGRLLDAGFTFEQPRWDDAAIDLCRRWRDAREKGPLSTSSNAGGAAVGNA